MNNNSSYHVFEHAKHPNHHVFEHAQHPNYHVFEHAQHPNYHVFEHAQHPNYHVFELSYYTKVQGKGVCCMMQTHILGKINKYEHQVSNVSSTN